MNYEVVEEFLLDLKEEFREKDKEANKVAELKRLKQGGKTIKEFIQKFRRVIKDSGYEK